MTSGFWCDRCWTVYGVKTMIGPAADEHRRRLTECAEERCFPIAHIFTELRDYLRENPERVPNQAHVIVAIDRAEASWRRRLPPEDPNRLED